MPALLTRGVQRIIGRRPTHIQITRKVQTTDPTSGAFIITPEVVAAFDARIEPVGMLARELNAMGIDVTRMSDWIMLAPPTASLHEGEMVSEAFNTPQGDFHIERVIPIDDSGFVCPLERVEAGG